MHRYLTRMVTSSIFFSLALVVAQTASAQSLKIGDAFTVAGAVDDIQQTTSKSGYTFRVQLTGLSYRGDAPQTLLEVGEANRLTLWLALRDVQLRIRRTTITGRPGSAVCGPLDIALGNQRELWIAFDLSEESIDGQPRLKIDATRFAIPQDNWNIGVPNVVRTSGFGMTRTRVSRALRDGLAKNRHEIENAVISIAPTLLAQNPEFQSNANDAANPLADETPILEAVRKHLAQRRLMTVDADDVRIAMAGR